MGKDSLFFGHVDSYKNEDVILSAPTDPGDTDA